jgi:hypothetical protein
MPKWLAALFHLFDHGPWGEISIGTFRLAQGVALWHLNETARFAEEPMPAKFAAKQLGNGCLDTKAGKAGGCSRVASLCPAACHSNLSAPAQKTWMKLCKPLSISAGVGPSPMASVNSSKPVCAKNHSISKTYRSATITAIIASRLPQSRHNKER